MTTTTEVNFSTLNLPIPDIISFLSEENKQEIYDYLMQLQDNHRKAYIIAQKHLGTSFNIYKSNGYKEWKNKNKDK